MFFQLLRGGRTEKTMPSEKGSRESNSSSSASPPVQKKKRTKMSKHKDWSKWITYIFRRSKHFSTIYAPTIKNLQTQTQTQAKEFNKVNIPSVIIWYISLSLREITPKPAMKASRRCRRRSSYWRRMLLRCSVTCSNSYRRTLQGRKEMKEKKQTRKIRM